MASSLLQDYGSEEQRVVEGIAALLALTPYDPYEDPDSIARRMAAWGVLQEPGVRWEAMWYVTHAMLRAWATGAQFSQLAEIGMSVFNEYNRRHPRE